LVEYREGCIVIMGFLERFQIDAIYRKRWCVSQCPGFVRVGVLRGRGTALVAKASETSVTDYLMFQRWGKS
jgi:hypothetical protein